MKKYMVMLAMAAILFGFTGTVCGGNGPAPNSGDGVSDGSGMDSPFGQNDSHDNATGPAPNSGDGVADGSGME